MSAGYDGKEVTRVSILSEMGKTARGTAMEFRQNQDQALI